MTTDLRHRLRAADPARTLPGYDVHRRHEVTGRIVAAAAADPGVEPGVGTPGTHRRLVPPRARRPLLIGAGAAALAGVLVAVPIVTGGSGGASPAAAEVLRRAADVHVVDPPARPGQYWRITTTGAELTVVSEGSHASSAYLRSTERTDYVAVDGSRPTWSVESGGRLVRRLSGKATVAAPPARTDTWTNDFAPTAQPATWQTPSPAFLAGLPRDPGALRDRLYADSRGEGRSRDGEALVFVADLLRSGLTPADLRSALYRVLETVPGVEVTASSATVDGRPGVALGRFETVDGERQEIVVDPATGELVGERSVQVTANEAVPAGTVVGETRVTRTPVDDVPAAVRAAARHEHCRVTAVGGTECSAGKG